MRHLPWPSEGQRRERGTQRSLQAILSPRSLSSPTAPPPGRVPSLQPLPPDMRSAPGAPRITDRRSRTGPRQLVTVSCWPPSLERIAVGPSVFWQLDETISSRRSGSARVADRNGGLGPREGTEPRAVGRSDDHPHSERSWWIFSKTSSSFFSPTRPPSQRAFTRSTS